MSPSAIQEVVAVLGHPVAGNPTQYLMEKAFAEAGLDWRCLTLEVADDALPDALRGLRALGFRGCWVAEPHSAEARLHLDRTIQCASLIGAVNCVQCVDGQLVGHNTIGPGLPEALREIVDPADRQVLLLGAGAQARAVGVALAMAGAKEIVILNRDSARGQALAELIARQTWCAARHEVWQGNYAIDPRTEIVVNATGIGCGDGQARIPLDLNTLESDMVVADMVLNPPDTRLIREACERDCATLDGLTIAATQAALAFETWTGRKADRELLRDALEEFLGL